MAWKMRGSIEIPTNELPKDLVELFRRLTVENPEYRKKKYLGLSLKGVQRFVPIILEKDGITYVSRRCLEQVEGDIDDLRSDGRSLNRTVTEILIELKDNQVEPVEKAVEILKCNEPVLFKAKPGTGKTVMAIDIHRRLGVSAMVVVDSNFLKEQWIARYKQFNPNAKVGVCQQDRMDDGNKYDVVIALIQSLTQREYPLEFWQSFGLVIFDECHIVSAESFRWIMVKSCAKKILGLTATPFRKDGMHEVFFEYLCPPNVVIEGGERIPRIEIRKTVFYAIAKNYQNRFAVKREGSDEKEYKKNRQKLFLILSKDDVRNDQVVRDIILAWKAGRTILAFSTFREHLAVICQRLIDEEIFDANYYIGGRKQADLDIAANARIILATYSMAEKALDIPKVDTVIFMTPPDDAEQAIGRGLRDYENKKETIVVDYWDEKVDMLDRATEKRLDLYKDLSYVVNIQKGKKDAK